MGGWRSRFVFLLIVYFAGFATAIYCLSPVPENQALQSGQKSFAFSALKSDEFAQSFNAGMYKCIDFFKEASQRAGAYLKKEIDSRRQAGS